MRTIVREWGVAAPTTSPSTTTPTVVGGLVGVVAGGGLGALLHKSLGWKMTSAAALGAGVGAVAGGVIGNATVAPSPTPPSCPAGQSLVNGVCTAPVKGTGPGGQGGQQGGSTTLPPISSLPTAVRNRIQSTQGGSTTLPPISSLPTAVRNRIQSTQPPSPSPTTPIAHGPIGWQANPPPTLPNTIYTINALDQANTGTQPSIPSFVGTITFICHDCQIWGATPSNSNWTVTPGQWGQNSVTVQIDGTPGSIDVDWGHQAGELLVTTLPLT